MSTVPVKIVDNSNSPVDATLHTELVGAKLIEVEQAWGPARITLLRQRLASGAATDAFPEHWRWNWGEKSADLRLLAKRCLGIECQGEMQGLIMVNTVGSIARLPPDAGKPLVYVEYIEVAPWNLRCFTDSPRFSGVGARLIEAAVRVSIDEGFHGRLGLHSLRQAEGFYRETCLMVSLGGDGRCESLPCYELTRENATKFLSTRGQP